MSFHGYLKVFFGEFIGKKCNERIGSVRRNALNPELVRSLSLTGPLAAFAFLAFRLKKN